MSCHEYSLLSLHIPYCRYAYVPNFEMAIDLCHTLGMNTKGTNTHIMTHTRKSSMLSYITVVVISLGYLHVLHNLVLFITCILRMPYIIYTYTCLLLPICLPTFYVMLPIHNTSMPYILCIICL